MFPASLNFTTHLRVATNHVTMSSLGKTEENNLNSFEGNRFQREEKAISRKEIKKSLRQKMEDKKNEHP